MITNKGKAIVAKYMIGQTPAYASYIAIGCGAVPLLPGSTLDTEAMSVKDSLDFETLRVPITSRGYVTEIINNVPVSQLIMTAQLPAESRYGISEVGLFPAANNPIAQNNDSRMLLNFDNNESWVVRDSSLTTPTKTVVSEGAISTLNAADAVVANSLDSKFTEQLRIMHKEVSRNGAYSIVTNNNLSSITSNVPDAGKYLLYSNSSINLSNSSPSDKLKIAFSVLPTNTDTILLSKSVKIIVEFGDQEGIGQGGYARAIFDVSINETDANSISRYFVKDIFVKDVTTYGSFSWNTATFVKVFVESDVSGYIALDGIRVDNVMSESPVYGLVGYTIVQNSFTTTGGTTMATPSVKEKDKTNLIEFRFQVDVGT